MTDPVLFQFQQKLEKSATQPPAPWRPNGEANPEYFLPGLKKKPDSGVSGDSHSDGTSSDSEKTKLQQKRIHSYELNHGGKRICVDDSDENVNVDVVGSESETDQKIDTEQHQQTINQFHNIMNSMSTRQRLFAQADRKRKISNRKEKIKTRLSELMKQVQYLQREYATAEDHHSSSTEESESCDEQAVNVLSSIILPGVESNVLEHIIRKELASLVVKVKDELQNMTPKQATITAQPEVKIEAPAVPPTPAATPLRTPQLDLPTRPVSRDISVKQEFKAAFKPLTSPLVSPQRTVSLASPPTNTTNSTLALIQQKQQQLAQTQQQIAALNQSSTINTTYQQAYQKALIQAKINQVEQEQKAQQQQMVMNQALLNRSIVNPFGIERTLSGFEGYPMGMEDIYGNLHKEGLTPHHLKKAKLMFFYTRYPSSSILKTYFPDVRFNRATTSQLIKWFSNFREFFYIHIEKIARQAVSDGITKPEDLTLSRDSELIRSLNNHYNKSNQFEVPSQFVKITEQSCREFFTAIKAGKDQDPSWKKTIYKVICKLDFDIPNKFKAATLPELGD